MVWRHCPASGVQGYIAATGVFLPTQLDNMYANIVQRDRFQIHRWLQSSTHNLGLSVQGLGFRGQGQGSLTCFGISGSRLSWVRFRVQGVEFRVLGSGFWVLGSGIRVQGSGSRDLGSGFKVQGSEFRVQGPGFRVQASGMRVQGSGFRVQDSGFRVEDFGWG